MNETHDAEDVFDQTLQKSLEQNYKAMKERDKQTYDGVVGLPPPWMPKWAVTSFKSYRNRLLDVRGYTHEGLLTLIERYRKEYYREEYIDGIEVSNFHYPATYPNGQNVDPYCFRDEIGFLTWLKWCADQKEKKGRRIIHGGFKETGEALNAKHARSREAKEFCISIAKNIWDVQVKRGDEEIDRMGEMVETLLEYLKKENHFLPKNKEIVRKWLIKGEAEGELNIPPEARKSGRPKKQP